MEGVSGTEKQLGRSEWDGEAAWKVGRRSSLEGVSGTEGGLEGVSGTEKWLGRGGWDREAAWKE